MKKLLFLFLLMSCSNSLGPGSGRQSIEVLYSTSQVDFAHGATLLPDGTFLVYGFTEGVAGAGEWTNAFPLLLFMHSDGTVVDTVVYRNIRYGEVIGAAPFGNEVAVLVDSVLRVTGSEPNSLKIHLLQAGHLLRNVIYSIADSMRHLSAPANPLVPSADNSLIFVFWPRHIADDGLIKINAAGEIAWTYDRVSSVAVTEEGDILTLGNRVTRLSPDGQVLWQKNYEDEDNYHEIVAVQDGAALLGSRFVAPRVKTIVLTRIDENGDLMWQRTYDEGDVTAETLTTLADGGFALGWNNDAESDGPGGDRSEIVRLTPKGEVVWRYPFGSQRTTRISRILALTDHRIVVIGVAEPDPIAGYGGDDWDILVMLLED